MSKSQTHEYTLTPEELETLMLWLIDVRASELEEIVTFSAYGPGYPVTRKWNRTDRLKTIIQEVRLTLERDKPVFMNGRLGKLVERGALPARWK